MDKLKNIAIIDDNDNLHLGRLIILIYAFSGRSGNKGIEGLTKLAKLDFLLRYPTYLVRALEAKGLNSKDVNTKDYEKKSVESSMIRYRYGPWDFRYRRFINLLVSKGLIKLETDKRTIKIALTENGLELANNLSCNESFTDIAVRANLLYKRFDISGTNLKNFIYETFPEITTLEYGEEIK
jgi:hypothetical protein